MVVRPEWGEGHGEPCPSSGSFSRNRPLPASYSDIDDKVLVEPGVFPGLAGAPRAVPLGVADDPGGARDKIPAFVRVPVDPEVSAIDRGVARIRGRNQVALVPAAGGLRVKPM